MAAKLFWLGAATNAATVLAAERLRVESATPAFDHELTREIILLEVGLYGWISNRKDCYVGQEVAERMLAPWLATSVLAA